MVFKAHFDGKVLVPDESVVLEEGVPLVVSVKPAIITGKGMSGKELAEWLETEPPAFESDEEADAFADRIRKGREPRYKLDLD